MIGQAELIKLIRVYDPSADSDLLSRAYTFSMKAHESQLRYSGDPYFTHPAEVAKILTTMKLDVATVATALLHDTVEDTLATINQIEENFGAEIARLVDGVTKLSLLELTKTNDRSRQAENFRKMFLAMSDDIRILLVKLADRLHNMQTLKHLNDPEKRHRIASETMDIFAPLAERFGMQDMKESLEDLAFSEINPDARDSVIARLNYLRDNSGDLVERISTEIKLTLSEAGIDATVMGREKQPWSIWKKMERDSISFEQLSDIVGFRIIVANSNDCYSALGIIHEKFQMVPRQFKDYISTPKRNGYRSIHTTVIGPEGIRIEVQIRGNEMHNQAELGVAAHWLYKQQADGVDPSKYLWVREILDDLDASGNPEEFLENTKLEMFQEQVFCFSPAGEVISLPRGASPVDFAYAVHTDIGDTCVGAKINGRLVPLRSRLRNGDQVEIVRSQNKSPSPSWESFVATGKARYAIRKFCAMKEKTEYAELGKKMIYKQFNELNHELNDEDLLHVLPRLNLESLQDLFISVGEGSIPAQEVLEITLPGKKKSSRSGWRFLRRKKNIPSGDFSVPIRGLIPGVAVHFASCCHPLPGDKIVGIVSEGKGVTIHTIDCDSLHSYSESPERWLDVSWDTEINSKDFHVARIFSSLANTPGSLSALTGVIARNDGNISNLKFTDRNPDFFELQVDIEVRDTKHLNNIIAALRLDPAIASVDRMKA